MMVVVLEHGNLSRILVVLLSHLSRYLVGICLGGALAYDNADAGILEFGDAVPSSNSRHLRHCAPWEPFCCLGPRARFLGVNPLIEAFENGRVRVCLIQQ